jgi:hypothetical protein
MNKENIEQAKFVLPHEIIVRKSVAHVK